MANLEKTPETEHLMPCGRRAQKTPLMQPGRALNSTYKSQFAMSNRFVCIPFHLQMARLGARLSGPTPHDEVASQAGGVVPPEPLLKVEYGYISY
jgi:hypothetical protein